MKKSRIGILTGGGDCAGLNPAMKWVVKTALDERLEWERGVRYEVVGIRDGWRGLVHVDLVSQDVEGHIVPLNQVPMKMSGPSGRGKIRILKLMRLPEKIVLKKLKFLVFVSPYGRWHLN